MAQSLAHRGPDGQGTAAFEGGCGLAHRRLAIIDLSPSAAQPMSAAAGQVWLAFNGEIYNYQVLRAELQTLGHVFHTESDTEVVLEAYVQWGEAAFARLDGMFAIALWDARRRVLLLARDRTGKKPLYVYEDHEKIVFGSEIKAILAHPNVDSRPNPEAVPQFLAHGYVPTPATFYAHIRSVRPAHFERVTTSTREPDATEYWDFPLGSERVIRTADQLLEVEHTLRELFTAAVKRRMVADVPLGAFLSGGIDSTLVVAVMSQLSSKPVKTFSIGFEGAPDFDETKYARLVADRYGTEHTEFKVTPQSVSLIETLAWHAEAPFADASIIPTYLVSKLTREAGCTVALTGDGGDEVFAGYSRFIAAAQAERMPRAVRRLARRLLAPLPTLGHRTALLERSRRFAVNAAQDLPERLRGWVSIFSVDEVRALVDVRQSRYATTSLIAESYEKHFRKAREAGADALNQVLYANAKTYLLDDLNVKVDRASMAVGLECRSPFLDTALMEYAFTLPAELKIKGRTTKWVLKRAMKALLPEAIVNRPKMGFGVPISQWVEPSRVDQQLGPDAPDLQKWALLQLAQHGHKVW
jgi:asparagine synthase (glutamine-hydrolysing)